jgi:predicted ATPase
MITELRLENWKSFGEATLYIDPLSILIGTNASGKSNVLEALQFLQKIATRGSVTDALLTTRGGIEWVAKKPQNTFALTVVIRFDDTTSYEYYIRCKIYQNECLSEKETLTCINNNGTHVIPLRREAGFGLVYSQASLLVNEYIAQDALNEESIGKPVLSVLRSICLLSPNPTVMTGYSLLSEQLVPDASNIAGVLAALSNERQKEIEDILTKYASCLPERDIHRVYAEKVGKLGKDAMLYCDEKWGESGEIFTVDARAMSDGTLRFLAILTALLTLPEGSLLAIDEVDNGFHPSRAHLLLEALQTIGKQRNIDVLVTTHNPALLDALGTEFVPFVTVAHRDSITGESKLTLLEDIEQLPKLLAQGTVGKLSTQGLIEKSLESVHG